MMANNLDIDNLLETLLKIVGLFLPSPKPASDIKTLFDTVSNKLVAPPRAWENRRGFHDVVKTQILTPRVWENRLVQIGNIFRFARIPARVGEPYKKSPSS